MAPELRVRLVRVRSAEFTPVPPGVTVRVEIPVVAVVAPKVSVEAVCARP